MMTSFLPSQAGFLQFEVVFGDPAANLAKVRTLLQALRPQPGAMITLPELWASGFDYGHARELADETPGLLAALAELAADHSVLLAGSLIEKQDRHGGELLYNTLYLVGPEGVAGSYRKQHPFRLWGEDRFFVPGGGAGPIRTPRGPVGALVCYDLRFPDLARIHAFAGAELILVSAQWPKVRLDHWRTLLQARAIENQLFIVACNGSGTTAQHELGGHSMVVGPDGRVLVEAGEEEGGQVVDLVPDDLAALRSRFCSAAERPYLLDSRQKIVTMQELEARLGPIRRKESRVAFTNGCFDILHSGHVAYLEQARKTADCLVVGLNSDMSVRALKGENRPVNGEKDRAAILAALGCVDFVVIFAEETPLNLIRAIMPDVLVKGADWPEDQIVGAAEVKAAGGRVVRVEFEHQQSTSKVIQHIQTFRGI